MLTAASPYTAPACNPCAVRPSRKVRAVHSNKSDAADLNYYLCVFVCVSECVCTLVYGNITTYRGSCGWMWYKRVCVIIFVRGGRGCMILVKTLKGWCYDLTDLLHDGEVKRPSYNREHRRRDKNKREWYIHINIYIHI